MVWCTVAEYGGFASGHLSSRSARARRPAISSARLMSSSVSTGGSSKSQYLAAAHGVLNFTSFVIMMLPPFRVSTTLSHVARDIKHQPVSQAGDGVEDDAREVPHRLLGDQLASPADRHDHEFACVQVHDDVAAPVREATLPRDGHFSHGAAPRTVRSARPAGSPRPPRPSATWRADRG